MLDDRGVLDGTPVFLDDETMMPVEPLCSWGRSLSNAELAPSTMKDYGRIIARFADYQSHRGRDLVSATESDLLAYKKVRTRLQKRPVGGAAWKKEAQLLDQFYDYLVTAGSAVSGRSGCWRVGEVRWRRRSSSGWTSGA